ncbi:lamin-C-like [Musca autumnalis]|uniref:lamin-C-like n=1 Tax=Musca autumnalis TaxID=221902 RepID=UPI003CF97FF5
MRLRSRPHHFGDPTVIVSYRVGSTQEVVRDSETTETQNENVRVDVSRKLKIEVNQLREKNEQLKARLEQRTTCWQIAEKKARMYESRAADLNAKYDAVNAYTKEAGDELCEVHAELVLLRKQMKEAHKRLQDEARARIELEGNIQRLRYELTLKEKFHSEEINELRTGLSKQYETKLQQSLQELREQHVGVMRKMETVYKQENNNLQAAANRESVVASSAIEELRATRTRIGSLNNRIIKLESTNAALNGRNCDLEKLLANERRRHASDIAKVEAELQRCRDEMTQQLHEYQDPMDIKDSLDFEVAAYKKLVCGSEKDDIGISECEAKAKFLKVPNIGTHEVQVDGRRFKYKIAPVSKWYVSSATHEEEVAGADHIRRTIIRHVSSQYIDDERFSGEKYPLRRKWIYHVFKQWKRSPHPSWLLKVLGAIT